jgi:large subunit ribosomal protein L4
MVVKVYGIDGSEQRDIDLADEVFNRSVSTGSIYHAIRNELANLRVGTASTKTRSEVRGSGAKPWRQKGTGRARAGTRQSPIWVGGGVAFGPKPRDYSYKIPKKLKRLAFKSIFSQKTQEERLMVVEDFTVESGKTRELVKILKGLTPENRTAIVISGEDSMLKRAGRNVPGLSILSYNRLRAHDLFYAGRVIVFEKAVEELGRMYGEPSSKRTAGKPSAVVKALSGAKPVALEKTEAKTTTVKAPAKPKAAASKAAPKKTAAEAEPKPDGRTPAAAKAKAPSAGPEPAAKGEAKAAKSQSKAAGKPATEGSKPSAKAPAKSKTTAKAAKAPAKSKSAAPKSKSGTAKPKAPSAGPKPAAKGEAKATKSQSKAAPAKASAAKAPAKSGKDKPAAPKKAAAKRGSGKTSKKDA